ncbi:hypothetical protein [Rhodopila sp.]|uniref:hypothetical protein n=1 Tax=Rhodopila sp. TaxID=2480087 RepID=UPI003D0CC4AA
MGKRTIAPVTRVTLKPLAGSSDYAQGNFSLRLQAWPHGHLDRHGNSGSIVCKRFFPAVLSGINPGFNQSPFAIGGFILRWHRSLTGVLIQRFKIPCRRQRTPCMALVQVDAAERSG